MCENTVENPKSVQICVIYISKAVQWAGLKCSRYLV